MIHEIKKTLEEWDVGLSKHETWNDGILFLPMFPPQGFKILLRYDIQDITKILLVIPYNTIQE